MDVAIGGRLFGACAVIALVLVSVNFVARRLLRSGRAFEAGGRILSIVETAFLPSGASLHVVRVAERYYAIARSGAHLATLCEIPPERMAHLRRPSR